MLDRIVQTFDTVIICLQYLNSIATVNLSSQFIQPNCQHQVPSLECLGQVKSNEFGWDKRCDPEWSSSLNTMAITNLNSTINKV